MRGEKLWTEAEERILLGHYPDIDRMTKLLSDRTRSAIEARCQRLGMKRPYHKWLSSEISTLRRLYPAASHETIKTAFPGITWLGIKGAARRFKIRRKTKPHLPCGKMIMDNILARIDEIGWTLADLDDESGTRNYFRNQSWRRSRLNFNAIAKAVRALDGNLEISWEQYG